MNKRLAMAAMGLTLVCAQAHAYRVDITVNAGTLNIEAHDTPLTNATLLELVNLEPFAVRCDVQFRNGPERRLRKVTVEAAGRHSVRFNPRREVVRLRITAECWPAYQDGDADDPPVDPDIDLIQEDG